jgi:hypothetical protein
MAFRYSQPTFIVLQVAPGKTNRLIPLDTRTTQENKKIKEGTYTDSKVIT